MCVRLVDRMYLQTKTLALVLSDANVLLIYAYATTKSIEPVFTTMRMC